MFDHTVTQRTAPSQHRRSQEAQVAMPQI